MNILFFSELFYPHGGGAEFATSLYAKLLSEKGFEVTVITNRFGNEPGYYEKDNIRIYRVPLFSGSFGSKYSLLMRADFFLTGHVRRLLKQSDLVYVPRLWYSAVPVADFYKKPVIVHLHDYMPICPLAVLYDVSKGATCEARGLCSPRCIYEFERNKKISLNQSILSVLLNIDGSALIRRFIECADAVVCVSDAQRNILKQRIPSFDSKAYTVYNPLPDVCSVDLDENDFGYFGGTNPLKGFNILYQALHSLGKNRIRVHVTGLTNFTNEMREFYSRVGMVLSERLAYDKQDLFYRMIGAVIFPSIVPEPLPYVTAEAILRGRILIASRIGGIPEQVKDCKGAYLVAPGDAKELATTVNEVRMFGKETVLDLGEKNRESFLKSFNNETIISRFIEIIDCLT